MYYIYSDEAGTSAKEPVTVVVGIVIHADKHWQASAALLNKILDDLVPSDLRKGFVFHAKDVWSAYRDHNETWDRESRALLIGAVASIPRLMGMAISIGIVRRTFEFPLPMKLKQHDFHHILAFRRCMTRADKYVRDWGKKSEVATVIAEDVPDKRRFLKAVLKINMKEIPVNEFTVMPTKAELESGKITQTNAGNISKIIDTPHFVEKGDAPLLQIADACAFSFRRFFAEESYGEKLLYAALGRQLDREEWRGHMSDMTFSFNPLHSYPKTRWTWIKSRLFVSLLWLWLLIRYPYHFFKRKFK